MNFNFIRNHKKITLFLTFSVFFVSYIFADLAPRKTTKGEEDWRYLKQAEESFYSGDYGTAFSLAEKSSQIRKQDSQWQHYILENVLKKSKVRKAGDDLTDILVVFKEQNLTEAYDIVSFHIEKKGSDYFDNKFSKVFEYVDFYAHYPEADFLMGKIYRLEGEYQVALTYLNSAYKYSDNLDVPLKIYDILYELADLSKDLGNYDDYEKYLLSIVKDNSYYGDVNFMTALSRVVKEDTADSVEKFFKLYRCENLVGLNALISLSEFYQKRGLTDKSLKASALAAIIAVTRLDVFFSERLIDYEYTSFVSLLNKCSSSQEVIEWGNDNNVWQLFYDFADISAASGSLLFARQLFLILSQYEPEEYWRKLALVKIS